VGKRHLLIVNVIIGAASMVRLLSSMAVIYLTLGWKVRKARKALEKELIKMGMPKEAAKRIGAKYAALKDDTINAMKRSFSGFGSSI
jgi:CHASE1-domain containing sensor protein